MLKNFIKQLMLGSHLRAEDLSDAIGAIMDGKVSDAQMAAFLIALRYKGETIEELVGAARAMRQRMVKVNIQRRPLIDTCGTGGDGAGTFNISTAVAFVAAAGGLAVAKHGNRAVSSRAGSADVLAAVGVDLEAPVETAQHCIEKLGVGFLFAPLMHPAIKHAMPVRKELAVRTIFNILGPLANPASAPRQLLGVFSSELTSTLASVLGALGSERAWVVHGKDGLDELSVCAPNEVAEWTGREVRHFEIDPKKLGITLHDPEGLRGGTAEENALILRELLHGTRQGALQDAVALNAGAAFVVADMCSDLSQGFEKARAILRAGTADAVLEKLIEKTKT